jgi:predicted N-acetyltransferase YhbS
MECEVYHIQTPGEVEEVLSGIRKYYSKPHADIAAVYLYSIINRNLAGNCMVAKTKRGKVIGAVIYRESFVDDNIYEASYLWVHTKYRHNAVAVLLMRTLIDELKLMRADVRPEMLLISIKQTIMPLYGVLGFRKSITIKNANQCLAYIKFN